MALRRGSFVAVVVASLCASVPSAALAVQGGTWQPLAHQPSFNASTMYLLTDGGVLCHDSGTARWYRLDPDVNGSYVDGTWRRVADTKYDRLYYAGAVFANGQVIVAGGEYSGSGSETNKTEIYNPVRDNWKEISAPTGWNNIGDAASVMMPDGRFLLGSIFDRRTAFYDVEAGTWTPGPDKKDSLGTEETWVLMADGTVICPKNWDHPGSEKYDPLTNSWFNTGNLPSDLVDGLLEIGAGILLPNGSAFLMGATSHSALYTSGANPGDPGTWTDGPIPPKVGGKNIGQDDGPCCLLPNGNVLLALGPVNGGSFLTPTYFFEYDGTSIVRVADPPNSGGYPFQGRMMMVPTGQVLFAADTHQVYVYDPAGSPDPAWKPSIVEVVPTLARGGKYYLAGRQLNGLSHCVGYGDDAGTNTNYPLVQLQNIATGHVKYLRSFDHSTMAVQTGNQKVSTNFEVPADTEFGPSLLRVVTNGIASDPVTVDLRDVNEIEPDWLQVMAGTKVAGGLPSLRSSNDVHLVLRSSSLPGSFGEIELYLRATLPTSSPTLFELAVESASTREGVLQTVELLDVQTGSYELVDVRGTPQKDGREVFVLSGNLARFVDPVQGTAAVRLRYFEGMPSDPLPYRVRLDQVMFTVK